MQALLPDHPEAIVYSAVMSVMMNLIGWTLGMFMMSGDRKHVSVKNFLINPTTLCLLIALPLFFTNTSFPKPVMNFVEFFSKMSTPTAMTVLGMRLAFVKFKDLMDYRQVVAIFLKLIALPLITFGIMYALPVDETLKNLNVYSVVHAARGNHLKLCRAFKYVPENRREYRRCRESACRDNASGIVAYCIEKLLKKSETL
ncbi:MAG: hypothetical protein L6V85_03420 [Clostridiales bacterium]|nr:MAG: hypothetical protein L6V85_03420 [Clostridiales bacterium]